MLQTRRLHHFRVHHRLGRVAAHQAAKDEVGDAGEGRLEDAALDLNAADVQGLGETLLPERG